MQQNRNILTLYDGIDWTGFLTETAVNALGNN
jgi:hypothetical protein